MMPFVEKKPLTARELQQWVAFLAARSVALSHSAVEHQQESNGAKSPRARQSDGNERKAESINPECTNHDKRNRKEYPVTNLWVQVQGLMPMSRLA